VKRPAFTATVTLLTIVGLATAWLLRDVVLMFLLSLALAAALRPLVDRLIGRGWSPSIALATVYLAVGGALLVLIYLLGGEVLAEIQRGAEEIGVGYGDAVARWSREGGLRRLIASNLPPPDELYEALGKLTPAGIAREAIGTTLGLLELGASTLVVVVLSIYWSAGRDAFERLWLSLLPVERRVPARAAFAEVRAEVGAELRAELGQSLIAAAVLALGFRLLGLEYWGVPAALVGLLRLVPLLGLVLSPLAVAPFALAAGPAIGGASIGLTVVVLVVLRVVVAPRFFRAPTIDPILAVLVILGLTHDYGFIGLVVAPMVAAAVQALFTALVVARPVVAPVTETRLRAIDLLRARSAAFDRRAADGELSPELVSMKDRLDALLLKADQAPPT
jgi:predicted PurR-regulated permease PerM